MCISTKQVEASPQLISLAPFDDHSGCTPLMSSRYAHYKDLNAMQADMCLVLC